MTESNDTTRPALSVTIADQPSQDVSDARLLTGLNVAQAGDWDVRPDHDALVVRGDDGSYFILDVPADTKFTGLRPGVTVMVANSSDGERLRGGLFGYQDNPGTKEGNGELAADVTLNGKKSPATIRRLASPEEVQPAAQPFTDTLVVASGGSYYEIVLSSEFEELKTGDAVEIAYAPAGLRETARFIATVISFDDTAKKQKYGLDGPVAMTVLDATGAPLPGESMAYRELAATLEETKILEDGEKCSRAELRRRLDRLTRELEKRAFLITPTVTWAEPGVSIRVSLTVVAPLPNYRLQLIPAGGTPPEWVAANADAAAVERVGRAVDGILRAHAPFSAKSWEEALKEIRQASRKDRDFDVEDVRIGTTPDGQVRVICVIAPEAKALSTTINGKKITSDEVDLPWPLPESIPARRLKPAGKDFFTALSARHAEKNEVLVTIQDGRLLPLIPEYRKVADEWRLISPGASDILSAKKPSFVRFDPPADAAGKTCGPRPDEWLAFFTDPDFPGQYTTAGIAKGLEKLTRWYDDRGYRFVGGHLDAELTPDGELRVTADLYRLSTDVVLLPEEGNVPAAKLEKHIRYIEREFRFHAGEFLNARDLADAIASVGTRFHVIAVPYVETDDATGTAKVTVKLVDDGTGGLDNLTLGGGYSGTSGAFVQAGEAFTSYNGFRNSASLSYYPQADLAGVGVTLATPRDEDGGTHEASLSGQYYLDYISSIGTNYDYVIPIGDSRFSFIVGAGAKALFSEGQAIDGTDALYVGPNVGIAYAHNGLSARLVAGPRISTQGAFYLGLEGGVSKRYDLNEAETLYLELYAKGGALIGVVPAAAQYHNVPIALHGHYVQPPIEAKLYAVAGFNLMQELPGGVIDVGIGASAGIVGATWAVGGGIKIRLKVFFPMTVTIGPALVDGIPTPITVSLGP